MSSYRTRTSYVPTATATSTATSKLLGFTKTRREVRCTSSPFNYITTTKLTTTTTHYIMDEKKRK